MKRTKPPFRADHVGSFLRPAALKEARTKREKGAITAAGRRKLPTWSARNGGLVRFIDPAP